MLRSSFEERGRPTAGSDSDQAGPHAPNTPQLDPVINIITHLELLLSSGSDGALQHIGGCCFLRRVMGMMNGFVLECYRWGDTDDECYGYDP